MASSNSSGSGGEINFATTQWSLVVSAGRGSDLNSQRALESLCQTYWLPLYAYVRRRVDDTNEAQDLTQAFFAELLDKNFVATADPNRGRFRAFLITSFKNFLSKQWDKAKAKKRGGDQNHLSLDFETADSHLRLEPSAGLTAEQIFDQQWAITLLGMIMDQLEAENIMAGKAEQFGELKGFLIGDNLGVTYSQAADRLGTTEAGAKQAVSRMRTRYRELLRKEIAETVQSPDDVQDEIRNLFASLKL